jgi:hypothetical protein
MIDDFKKNHTNPLTRVLVTSACSPHRRTVEGETLASLADSAAVTYPSLRILSINSRPSFIARIPRCALIERIEQFKDVQQPCC